MFNVNHVVPEGRRSDKGSGQFHIHAQPDRTAILPGTLDSDQEWESRETKRGETEADTTSVDWRCRPRRCRCGLQCE